MLKRIITVIKVLFYTTDFSNIDIQIEKETGISSDISDWLEKHIHGISLDCMDYPFDLENNYAVYFSTSDDATGCNEIFDFIKSKIPENSKIKVQISTVKDCFDSNEKILYNV